MDGTSLMTLAGFADVVEFQPMSLSCWGSRIKMDSGFARGSSLSNIAHMTAIAMPHMPDHERG